MEPCPLCDGAGKVHPAFVRHARRRRIMPDGSIVNLNNREARIFDMVWNRWPHAVHADALIAGVFGEDEPDTARNMVSGYICRMNRRLSRCRIASVPRFGYRLEKEES